MLRIDNLRRMLATPTEHPQGMISILPDIRQPTTPETHLYTEAGMTYTTKASLPLWLIILNLPLHCLYLCHLFSELSPFYH